MKKLMSFVGPLMAVTTLGLIEAEAAPDRGPTGNDAGIRGVWYPYRTEQKLPGEGWKIEISENNLAISYTRAVPAKRPADSIDIVRFQVPFAYNAERREHRIVPPKDAMGVTPLAFHLEGDRLIIDDGAVGDGVSLRGEWRRSRPKD